MRSLTTLTALLCLFVLCAGTASAHSTKGRVKAPLTKPAITVSDVAYFVEAYVHRDLYAGTAGGNDQRFYVKDFISLKQDGNHAQIKFTVLDKKENKSFPESMAIQRRADGTWDYVSEVGAPPIQVFTFVKKGAMTPQQERLAIFVSACIAVSVILVGIRSRRKRRDGQHDTVATAPGDGATDETNTPDTGERS